MSSVSPNLQMTLPEATDNVNIGVLTTDLTKIDTAYGTTTTNINNLSTRVGTAESSITSLSTTVGGHTTSIGNLTTAVNGKAASTHSHASDDWFSTHSHQYDTWFTTLMAGKSNILYTTEYTSGKKICNQNTFNTIEIAVPIDGWTPIAIVGYTIQDYNGGTTSKQYCTPLGFRISGTSAFVYCANRDSSSHDWKATVNVLYVRNW